MNDRQIHEILTTWL